MEQVVLVCANVIDACRLSSKRAFHDSNRINKIAEQFMKKALLRELVRLGLVVWDVACT